MNEINNNDSNLKQMLLKSTIEQPSANFTDNLLGKLQQVEQKQSVADFIKGLKPKHWFIIIPTNLVILCLITGGVFWLFGIDVSSIFVKIKSFLSFNISIDFSFISTKIKEATSSLSQYGDEIGHARYIVYLAIITLFLLTIDLLFRKRYSKKHQLQ